MRRWLAIVGACCIAFILAACGEPPVISTSPNHTTATGTFSRDFQLDPTFNQAYVWVRVECNRPGALFWVDGPGYTFSVYSPDHVTVASTCAPYTILNAIPQSKHS